MLQSFEALNQRAVAVVVDPIQSVKGKVVIDAFRCAFSTSIPTFLLFISDCNKIEDFAFYLHMGS